MAYDKIQKLLDADKVVLLDGGFGTELRRRQVPGIDDPHIWSARGLLNSPRTVLDVHRDYLLAGADVITAGAFRTNSRALRKAGLDYMSRSLTQFAVSLAIEMRTLFGQSWEFAVAGNITSLEDCYEADKSPGLASMPEHKEKVRHLVEAKADLILFESIPTLAEAVAALRAMDGHSLPVWLSLVLAPDDDEPKLLDGTPLRTVPARLRAEGRLPDVLLFNCCPPETVSRAIPILRSCFDGQIGAYANAEKPYEAGKPWRRRVEISSELYADAAMEWVRQGAVVIGGCCGTTPEDIRAIRERLGWSPRPIM